MFRGLILEDDDAGKAVCLQVGITVAAGFILFATCSGVEYFSEKQDLSKFAYFQKTIENDDRVSYADLYYEDFKFVG